MNKVQKYIKRVDFGMEPKIKTLLLTRYEIIAMMNTGNKKRVKRHTPLITRQFQHRLRFDNDSGCGNQADVNRFIEIRIPVVQI